MTERIKWNSTGTPTRTAVAELCGWCNKHGNVTPHGKVIVRSDWDDLSSAARRIMSRHGITG